MGYLLPSTIITCYHTIKVRLVPGLSMSRPSTHSQQINIGHNLYYQSNYDLTSLLLLKGKRSTPIKIISQKKGGG